MDFRIPIQLLKRCPSCRSRRLVLVLYGLKRDPLGGIPTLECEGCCTVVRELSGAQVAAMRKTAAGRAIIDRESRL